MILIDATRVVDGVLLPQTRRHSALAKLVGIRHVVVAVNKLDQLEFSESVFDTIVGAYRRIADRLGLADVTAIPVSALHGDNVATRSERMPWYRGQSLLEWLEQVPSALEDNQRANTPLRFAVQYVLRGFDAAEGSARGYAGRIGSGVVVPGQQVRILPSGTVATVHSVSTYDGDLAVAQPGQSVVIRLDREVDVSRGDWLVDDDPDTQPIQARVKRIDSLLDLASVEWRDDLEPTSLGPNDIARVVVETQQPIALDPYDRIAASGSFVLADIATNHTVGAGMVRADSTGGS